MRHRRISAVALIGTIVLALFSVALSNMPQPSSWQQLFSSSSDNTNNASNQTNQSEASEGESNESKGSALAALHALPVKGKAPKTGYERAQFGDGWGETNGCSTRNIILNRDLTDVVLDEECKVVSGVLDDPYTGERIYFTKEKSSAIQIDHVVALSNAWQTGALQLSKAQRVQLANDPLELLAVSGPANQAKSDGDAATWLPKNKAFRCQYVARQIAIKTKYTLWLVSAEKEAMETVLSSCKNQPLP